ncbi:sphingomyelin phosphodiesterase isoform X3 [Folsomia candida]|uniref:sphingomyelin phosphodiesterase isoform X3 n=1 Tax=Folsomia candida TaxID=158441 RepID=UPI0016050676|nr:sphingomyelin phosphodiesterase isoform X3 [Folsomia candida]
MSSSRETQWVRTGAVGQILEGRGANSYANRCKLVRLVGAVGILLLCASISGSKYSFVTATPDNLLSLNHNDNHTPSPRIPLVPQEPASHSQDIYTRAVEFLVNKRTRLQQQQKLHRQLLQQYKEHHITHPGVSVSVKVHDNNAHYSMLSLRSSSSLNNNSSPNVEEHFEMDDDNEKSNYLPRKRADDRSKVHHEPDDGKGGLLRKEMEIDELTHQVVDATLNQTSTRLTSTGDGGDSRSTSTREDSGRSLDGVSSIFSRFSSVLDLSRVVREIETSVMSSVSCSACKAGVSLLNHYVQSGRRNSEIAAAAIKLCINLKMQTPRVCTGIVDIYVDEIVEVLKGVVLDSNDICALVIGETCGVPVSPNWRWDVAFPPIPKPPFHGFPEPKKGAPKLKVLQISDTHWDPYYEPGSNADCGEPLCCRVTSGPKPPRPHLGAGLWGDYRKCDTPRNTMESMFEHISKVHSDIDYIIWTGDIPAHDVWNQTHDTNLKMIRETVDLFSQYFPYVPIFPALGNHEAAPVNGFAPPWVTDPKFSIDWLYKELQNDWSRWLPDTTQTTIREGAFYSTLIKPGFKLISLNMNYCNNKNWWLLVNSTDPVDELKWLIFELQSSELLGEKVHIIGHIPPGHADCMATWSTNYYDIISRYEGTVAAQFFGHTHYDEMEIFYPKEDPYRAASIAYIGPSVTPYFNLNPGYRIYYVDGDYPMSTRSVVDHDTWVTDLGEANRVRARQLTWYKLYSAREAYGLSSLNPLQWDELVMSMYENKPLFNLYYRFYNKNSPVAPECDAECKARLLCDIRSGRSHDREELCKPRPPHIRISRGGLAEPKPPSKLSQIFSLISSAL